MIININTIIHLNFDILEYSELITEISMYCEEFDTNLSETLVLVLEDLEVYKKVVSKYTVTSKIEMMCFGNDFFYGLEEEIQEMDIDEYPLLIDFLITIANKL